MSAKSYQNVPPIPPTVPTPWQYSSITRKWVSLYIVTAACAIVSGPVMSWPTLLPLFQAQGVFKSSSSQESLFNIVYTIACGAAFVTSLPAGIVFDQYGGRACGIYGALGSSVGLFIIALSCLYPEEYSWLLFIGYPLTMSAGFLSSNCVYTFNWLLPDSQNFISGLNGGATALSDMLAIVAVWLHNSFGLPITTFFFGLSFICVLSALICMYFVPRQDFAMQCAMEVVIGRSDTENGGLPSTQQDSYSSNFEEISSLEKISRSWNVFCMRPKIFILVLAFSSVYFLSIILPIQDMFYYYQAIWPGVIGFHTAISLVNMYAIIYGCGGFICAIVGGKLCDAIGVVNFTLVIALCSLTTVVCLLIETKTSQIVAQILLTFGSNLYGIVIIRYCVLYVPQDLFGTASGLMMFLVSIGLACGYILVYIVSQLLNTCGYTFEKFQGPFVLVGVFSAVLGFSLAYYWWKHPPPSFSSGERSDDDECKQLVNLEIHHHSDIYLTNGNREGSQLILKTAGRPSSTVDSPIFVTIQNYFFMLCGCRKR